MKRIEEIHVFWKEKLGKHGMEMLYIRENAEKYTMNNMEGVRFTE